MFKKLMAAAALATIATTASAAPTELFFDDFDSTSNIPGGNTTPTGWSVSGGTVDIVGPPSYFPRSVPPVRSTVSTWMAPPATPVV